MEINCSHSEVVDIDSLIPNPRNPNKHPEAQVKLLAKIMKHQGWRSPIIVSKRSGFIVKGHGRIEAAKINGWDEVPIDKQDYASEADEYADMIADNKIAELAESDLMKIQELALDMGPDFDFDLLGIPDFKIVGVDTLPPGDPDDVPEPPKEAKTKPGDIYVLGNHRLMCGDSTNIQHVETLMNGAKADITFTSPPYNAAKDSHLHGWDKSFSGKYENNSDAMSDDDFVDFLSSSVNNAMAISRYVFWNMQMLTHNRTALMKWLANYGHAIKDILIWNKKTAPPNITVGAFNTKYEFVFCLSEDRKTRGFPVNWRGQYPNVVETENNSGNENAEQHRAGFPVSFPIWFLEKLDFANIVYEPFGGTGTTMIACEKTNRKCFMMEIDPIYCDVIVERWEKYTGKKAELVAKTTTKA